MQVFVVNIRNGREGRRRKKKGMEKRERILNRPLSSNLGEIKKLESAATHVRSQFSDILGDAPLHFLPFIAEEEDESALLLPSPLYLIYRQVAIYVSTFHEKNVQVEREGRKKKKCV